MDVNVFDLTRAARGRRSTATPTARPSTRVLTRHRRHDRRPRGGRVGANRYTPYPVGACGVHWGQCGDGAPDGHTVTRRRRRTRDPPSRHGV